MRRFIRGIFTAIGVMTFMLLIILGWSFYRLTDKSIPPLASQDTVVLNLTLGEENLPEQPQAGGIMALFEGQPLTVYSIVEGLTAAAKDPRVKGIILTISGESFKIASVQEIRDALKTFKANGKFVYAYADTFGDLSNGTLAYYLASVSNRIWLMPLGSFSFTGLMVEAPFARKALEDFRIRPQMGRREEYKGAVESFTETDFSPAHRENIQRILDTVTAQILKGVALDRGLETVAVRQAMDTAPSLPQHALDRKMVDDVGYKDQMKEAIEKLLANKPEYYPFDSYIQAVKKVPGGEKVAIIYAQGLISQGKTRQNPLAENAVIDASEVAGSLQEAAEDDTIKAIILRVDSGGGSPVGSEIIGREMERARLKKPVIVSMANYAASGGYWIACSAHKIVAEPGTLTGSIGVYAGKIVTQGFWEHYGIHWGEIHTGDNATVGSTGQEYTEKGWDALNAYLDKIYDLFLDKVARGRRIPKEQVRLLAKGQVWTGEEAKANGLVDAIGGLGTAIDLARKEAGIAADASLNLIHLPAPKSFLNLLLEKRSAHQVNILASYPALNKILKQAEVLFSPSRVNLKTREIEF